MAACDAHLANHRRDPDDDEEGVGEDAGEDVALAVDLARVDLVEERHHDERVEDHGEVLRGRVVEVRLAPVIDLEDVFSREQHRQDDGQLVDRVSEDVLRHRARHERFRAAVRLAIQQLVCGQLRGER